MTIRARSTPILLLMASAMLLGASQAEARTQRIVRVEMQDGHLSSGGPLILRGLPADDGQGSTDEPGNTGSLESWSLSICALAVAGSTFDRGDCNGDDGFNIADAIALLSFLFTPGGAVPPCDDAPFGWIYSSDPSSACD